MQTITFECEVITPMFLAGADGVTPELRPASIKGALRFWWRAMNGHLIGKDENVEELLEEDEKLFGGTNQGKSSINIRVSNIVEKKIDGKTLQKYADYNGGFKYGKPGLAYLFYVLLNQKLEGLEGYDTSTKFDLIVSSKEKKDLQKACATLWLFIYLGGLGSRARRGAGSINISQIKQDENYLLDENGKQVISFDHFGSNDFVTFFNENYKKASKILGKKTVGSDFTKDSDSYSTLSSNEIYISNDTFSDWSKALNDIGKNMKITRDLYEYDENRKFTLEDIPLKATFGLPIQIRTAPNFKGYYVDLNNSTRRASPLIISVVKCGENKFRWLLTYLDGKFSDDDDKVVIRNSKKEIHKDRRKNDFSWSIIDEDKELIRDFFKKLSMTRIK